MAEFLSPGVYIEEVASNNQAVQAVGTSTMAIVGWTPMGPVDSAKLVTSPESYSRQFGDYTNDSRVPMSVSAYFANGGTRAYVVRVVPSDATAATASTPGAVTGETVDVGDGTSPQTLTSTLAGQGRPGSVVVHWTKVGGTQLNENPVTSPAEDGVATGPFTFTINPLQTPTWDTLTLSWSTVGPVSRTATFTFNGTSETTGGADIAQVTAYSINRNTGACSFTFSTAPLTDSIRVSYTYRGATASVTDDGAGAFTATGVAGTINYLTGALSVTFTGSTIVPYNGNTVTVDYDTRLWDIDASNKGAWGNDLKVIIAGNEDSFVYGPESDVDTGKYMKYDFFVYQKDSAGVFQLKETYEELEFSDSGDAMYFPEVVNDASDLVVVTDYGFGGGVPETFKGVHYTAESLSMAPAFNGTVKAFTTSVANAPVVKTSLRLKLVDGGNTSYFTADAAGNLSNVTGNTAANLDTTKTNTINWTTGALVLNFATAPSGAATLSADYVAMPVTSSLEYTFSGGSDGTLSGLSRSEFSAPTLQASKRGIFALDRVDEMMQLIIPDFAGDTLVTGDMIDYAEGRKDIFCILTTPQGSDAQEAVDYIRITLNRPTKYAAMYWPWVKVADPLNNNRPMALPPVAHVAGVYARTDVNKNVGKAPGGTSDGALRFLTGLEYTPDKGDRDTVTGAKINSLIDTPQTGKAVWGVRTMSADSEWRYINAVRLFMFVEKSVFNATHWAVFESIGPGLYSRLKTQLDNFLNGLFTTGHFAGRNASEAYFVVCDESNNPAAVVNAGQVVVDVAIAPNKPGEFIRFRFAQFTAS